MLKEQRVDVLFCVEVEETILESLAWKSASPLWDALAVEDSVPGVEDVSFANQLEREDGKCPPPSVPILSPLMNPALRRIAAGALTPTQKGEQQLQQSKCLSQVSFVSTL